jgi:hypothetical protein
MRVLSISDTFSGNCSRWRERLSGEGEADGV